jgi:hypothetical protein
MSKLVSILVCSAVVSIFSFEAQAFSSPAARIPVTSPEVVPVRGFCGLGFHRGPYGYCVRNGAPYGYGYGYAAPVVVAPRVACPYPYHYSPGYGGCIQ